MRRLRRMARWLFDYRNGLTLVGTGLLILLSVTVTDSIQSRNRAFDALKLANRQQSDARAAATRRIDLLQQEIAGLRSDAQANGGRISELLTEVTALQEQVRQMGGRPVVTEQAATTATTTTVRTSPTTTTTRPAASPAPIGPPATTTTTRPPPPPTTTSTTTCVTVLVVSACH